MATIQDVFSHIYTTEAHLGDVAVKNGQIILCTDSEKLYIDHGSNRVSISDVVQVETQTALPLAPLDKFYITQDTGDVYFYINDEWKKLTDTIKDYTAFEVYANDSVIPPGEHEVLGTITVEIPVQMTETFALCTTTPEADSDVVVDWGDGTIQKVKDGEHGGYTGPDGEGRYIAKMTHTYGTAGKYTVKVYGHDYFCLSHAPSHVSDASNMQCRILADDLPIASHLTNLTAFAYGTLKLVTVQCASYKYLHRTTNHAQMFTNDKNLLSVTGFEDLVMISRGAEGCFQFCENMHTCDFNGVLCSNNPRAMYAMYQNCYALAINIGTFFPTKFVSRALNFTNTFTHMHAMTGTVDPNQFWGDPNIDWQGFSNCFYGCPDEIRSQVPTSWGGTSSAEIVGDLPVAKLSLNGTLPNTANGLVMLNASGKIDSSFLPPQAAVNIDNYTSNNTIKLTSTAGAVNLISNTGEAGLYSGSNVYVKALTDTVELKATTVSLNGHAQNTSGGFVVVDTDTGKIPDSLLPSGDLDLSNYSTSGNIKLSAGTLMTLSGLGCNINATGSTGLQLGTTTSNTTVGSESGRVAIQANGLNNLVLITPDKLEGAVANTAHGFAIVGANGKLPTSIIPASTIDLSAYTGGINLTGTTDTDVVVKYINSDEMYNGTVTLNEDGFDVSAYSITMAASTASISGNLSAQLTSSGTTTIGGSTINLSGMVLQYNGHDTNTASGLVQLDTSGKVPESLLPEIGNASWTKVTLNQADFATEDTTYGGSYKELDGICSVEVYDADGYKVEFDVKCDFTNNKTRVYIPSGLAADTISNWTLLYLAKTIA